MDGTRCKGEVKPISENVRQSLVAEKVRLDRSLHIKHGADNAESFTSVVKNYEMLYLDQDYSARRIGTRSQNSKRNAASS